MKQWDVNWGSYRRRLVFADSAEGLLCGVEDLITQAEYMCAIGEAGYASELVAAILIDLQSALTVWKLDKKVTAEEKSCACSRLYSFLQEHGQKELMDSVAKEVESIANSQFARITRATDAGELFTYWGSDLCTGVDFSLRRGASFTTSNPSKINQFRQAEPAQYAEYVRQVMQEYPGLSKEEILSYVTVKVVAQVARQVRPIFEATDGKFGVSFTQVSPTTWNDVQGMIDEVRLWYAEFQKELCTDKPNVVFKIPATPAAVEAAKVLLKDSSIRLTFTSNFGVGQHRPFYELIHDREPNCFLVVVDCHLRKFARLEFDAMGVQDPDYYCQQLVWAVYQKCYQNLLDSGSHAMLNGAGMREDVGIRLCLTNCAQLPYTLTVTPMLAADFDSKVRSMEVIWDKPISAEDMEILNKCSIFRQAYYEDEFPWNDIESFAPYKFMMDGFMEARSECLAALPEYK